MSGCARECAEAQSKDVGVIATERGWNLYVVRQRRACGPQHAELLAEDLDDETLIRYIDRFLMFYVRTADRLERTATWFNKLEGGLDHLRAVVDRRRARHLRRARGRHGPPRRRRYECEWTATLDDPERLARFVSFVNSRRARPDSSCYVRERGQRPARRCRDERDRWRR